MRIYFLSSTDNSLILIDDGGDLDTEVFISGTGAGNHSASIDLTGAQKIRDLHKQGETSIEVDRPQ